jgi:hypothetical protein
VAGFPRFPGPGATSVVERIPASCAAQRDIREVPYTDIELSIRLRLLILVVNNGVGGVAGDQSSFERPV